MVEAYCVKCKKKGQKMEDPTIVQTKRGGYMAKGKCCECGTSMCAMMSKDNAEKAIKEGAEKSFCISFVFYLSKFSVACFSKKKN